MYRTTTALALSLAAFVPVAAEATPVKISVTIANYTGPNTYLALYLTDASGKFDSTIWVAGSRARYWQHLRTWFQATGGQVADGMTGASVGAGRSLTVTADISDAMLQAGYVLHIDAAAENIAESPNDIVVPLTKDGAGKAIAGSGFVTDLRYDL